MVARLMSVVMNCLLTLKIFVPSEGQYLLRLSGGAGGLINWIFPPRSPIDTHSVVASEQSPAGIPEAKPAAGPRFYRAFRPMNRVARRPVREGVSCGHALLFVASRNSPDIVGPQQVCGIHAHTSRRLFEENAAVVSRHER
jgi:hypothetical protein